MTELSIFSTKMFSQFPPRDIFGKVLLELASKDDRIVVISPDLMRPTRLTNFAQKYPKRAFNTGITEQASVGIAAGMAASGLVPFVATFACFASMRSCEQIRTDIAYPKLNVKIIGSHAGLTQGAAGTTHHATEDIAIIRSIANMVLLVPSDNIQLAKVLEAALMYHGPCYIRLIRGSGNPTVIYKSLESCPFQIGKAITIKNGDDATIIAAGNPAVQESFIAAQILENEGLHVRVVDMVSIKPIDQETILSAAKETQIIVTVEDHNIIGGLGGAVAEILSERMPTPMKRIGIPDTFSTLGPPERLWRKYGLNSASIARTVHEFFGEIKNKRS